MKVLFCFQAVVVIVSVGGWRSVGYSGWGGQNGWNGNSRTVGYGGWRDNDNWAHGGYGGGAAYGRSTGWSGAVYRGELGYGGNPGWPDATYGGDIGWKALEYGANRDWSKAAYRGWTGGYIKAAPAAGPTITVAPSAPLIAANLGSGWTGTKKSTDWNSELIGDGNHGGYGSGYGTRYGSEFRSWSKSNANYSPRYDWKRQSCC